jgi:hypothetical protein
MSSYNPGLVLPFVVTASNKWIDFTRLTSNVYAASLAVGTYYSMDSLETAFAAAMTTAHTVGYTIVATNGTPTSGTAGLAYWYFTINAPSAIALKWSSGAHAASSAYSLLGYNAVDIAATDEIEGAHQLPNVWVSNRAPASDTFDRRKHSGGEARESINGAYHVRLAVARPRMRKIEFEAIAKQRTLDVNATGAYTNMAFESFWERAITGEQFAYYNDWTTIATAANSSGNYYLIEPDDMMDIKRTHVGTEVYSFGLTMQRKET